MSAEQAAEKPAGGKKMMVIIIAAVLVLVLVVVHIPTKQGQYEAGVDAAEICPLLLVAACLPACCGAAHGREA